MSYYPDSHIRDKVKADSHIRDKVKVVLGLSSYATKKALIHLT